MIAPLLTLKTKAKAFYIYKKTQKEKYYAENYIRRVF